MKDRQKEAERIAKESSKISLDNAERPKEFTKQDFEDALNKVSRKIEPTDKK